MYAYRTPGVHVEWLGASRGIGVRRTDIAGFAGIAERGPLHEPVRVQSWAEFTGVFGGHLPVAFLAYAVAGFFANSGRTCWVVRVADPEQARTAGTDLFSDRGPAVLRLTAASAGTWAHSLTVTVVRTLEGRFTLGLRLPDGAGEQWRALSTNPADPRFAVQILKSSELVSAELSAGAAGAVPRTGSANLTGGADGLRTLLPSHLSGDGAPPDEPWGLAALNEIDEVGIVAAPDIMAPGMFTGDQTVALQEALIRQCLLRHDRFAILDPRPADRTTRAVLDLRGRFDGLSAGEWAGLYYPWLRAPDPLAPAGVLRDVPPSGHVAGVLARTDQAAGVHKAPANELVEGSSDVVAEVDDATHGELNDRSVNVIRPLRGRGLRVAGARTLSSAPQMRYVNVRRLLSMIEEAIDEQIQWTVFEPSTPDLWRDVDRVVRGFLEDLWRAGMLDGASAGDAFFVVCDRSTNTGPDIDAGRLICRIGLQPPVPAEFVVVRITRDANTIDFEETAGVAGG